MNTNFNRTQVACNSCPKCSGLMKPGKAIEQTYKGTPEFPGAIVTMSPGGPGRMIDCMKCSNCGHSLVGVWHVPDTKENTLEPIRDDQADRMAKMEQPSQAVVLQEMTRAYVRQPGPDAQDPPANFGGEPQTSRGAK